MHPLRHLSSVIGIVVLSGCARGPTAGTQAPPGAAVPPTRYLYSGLGLVSGLHGTGDGDWPILSQILRAQFPGRAFSRAELKTFAVVMIHGDTTERPRPGDRLAVQAFTMCDETRLDGGVMLRTPLRATIWGGTIWGDADWDHLRVDVSDARVPAGATQDARFDVDIAAVEAER